MTDFLLWLQVRILLDTIDDLCEFALTSKDQHMIKQHSLDYVRNYAQSQIDGTPPQIMGEVLRHDVRAKGHRI